jgi:D-alanyl-D-alanine carboxypeptidase
VIRTVIAAVALAAAPSAWANASVEAELAAIGKPAAIFVTGGGADQGYADGLADPATGRELTVDTPVRIASNTKTFTAAAVLRLWEQGRIDLDAPIGGLVNPRLDHILRGDGYDTSAITVRHLLSHSGGLYDHGGDKRFVESLMTNPGRVWTREALVKLATDYADPQSRPGTEFRYSDTGYILLGDIVERITGKTLATSVRELLKLDTLGLKATWWEIYEAPPKGAEGRAKQFIGDRDVTAVDPSMDLFGGGGQLMSARDLATFFKTLFEGRVFDKPATIREMLWKGPHRNAETYRLGIFVQQTPKGERYWHSGFWGTYAAYAPATGIALGTVTTRQGTKPLMPLVDRLMRQTP